jgi:DNA-binding response OmpR family regulator
MGKRILLVDDEPELLMLVEARLLANGYEVGTASDGQAALEKVKLDRPDLIILDLMLPKMDGFRVCALLKKDSLYAKIPIILFTAKVQKESQKMGEEAGADAYVIKPFEPQILLKKIQELIQK